MKGGYSVKDTGERMQFATGSQRDTEDDKLDFGYVLRFYHALKRFTAHLTKGGQKYGRHNWHKGQQMSRTDRSLFRHVIQYANGERDEDHLAAIWFNAGMLMDHEERIAIGELPLELDDRDEHRRQRYPDPVGSAPSGEVVVPKRGSEAFRIGGLGRGWLQVMLSGVCQEWHCAACDERLGIVAYIAEDSPANVEPLRYHWRCVPMGQA